MGTVGVMALVVGGMALLLSGLIFLIPVRGGRPAPLESFEDSQKRIEQYLQDMRRLTVDEGLPSKQKDRPRAVSLQG
jgi:hypothetical protein